tara:strand:- start:2289 stop:4022 length:1734 start_codon:yes stop_codon:yes gene_type:complete
MNLDIYQQTMNLKTKVSIIGLGKWGSKIKNSIEHDVELVDPSEANWIIISTPNDLHYEQVKYWLNQNKNVFCEKPLTLTLNTTKELYDLADELKVKLYVDNIFLWRDDINLNPIEFIWNKKDNTNFIDRLAYHHFYLWIKDQSNIEIDNIEILSDESFFITLKDGYKGYFNYSKSKNNNIHIIDNKEVKEVSNNPLKEMLLSIFNNKVNYLFNKQITLNATKISEEVKKKIYPKVLVVGGGIFGTTAAISLSNTGYNVELHEELDDIMKCATGINQYRLHKGYHYPRSKKTAIECKKGLKTFKRKYKDSVLNGDIEHLYSIASKNSLVSVDEYINFLKDVKCDYKTVESLPNTDLTIKVNEELFDVKILYNLVKSKLKSSGIKVILNKQTTKTDLKNYDIIVIATYSKLNNLLENKREYQFEVCEKPVVKLPKQYKNKSIVIMDGPFMCLDPYGQSEYHVLGNVVHAIHETNTGYEPKVSYLKEYLNKGLIKNPKYTNIDKFIKTGKQFFKDFDKLKHIGSLYTIRTVLKNRDYDDARPTLVRKEGKNIYSLFSGKIDTCLDASNQLVKLIQNKKHE